MQKQLIGRERVKQLHIAQQASTEELDLQVIACGFWFLNLYTI